MFGPLNLIRQDSVTALVLVLTFLFGLTLHGAVQARLAARLGDKTALRGGYGSLAPRQHFTLLGVVAYLLLGLGRSKPVPLRLTGRRAALVLLAGPLTLALTALLIMVVRQPLQPLAPGLDVVFRGLQYGAKALLLHAVFFLLPLPDLDGGRALWEGGGREVRRVLAQLAAAGPVVPYLLWLALTLSGALSAVLAPLWSGLQAILGLLPF